MARSTLIAMVACRRGRAQAIARLALAATIALVGAAPPLAPLARLAPQCGAAWAESEIPPTEDVVRHEDDRLTVAVRDMSLHALLREIGRQTHAQVRIEGVADRPVSDRFTRLPLDEALRRLLAEENFTLTYRQQAGPAPGGGARLTELQIYGGAGPAGTLGSVPDPGPAGGGEVDAEAAAGLVAAGASGSMMEQLSQLLQRHARIEVPADGQLAAALGSEAASVQELVATAMRADDARVRVEAAKVLAGVFDGDPQAGALVSSADAAGMDAGAIAALMRTSGGPHADEFLLQIAMHLRTPALRVRANQILAALRSAP
jgi:hypothetical protein